MTKPATVISSLCGIAVCAGAVWIAAAANSPANAPEPVNSPAAGGATAGETAPTTATTPPTSRVSDTAQERVAPQGPALPVIPVVRAPVTGGPLVPFQPNRAATGVVDRRSFPASPDYPPPRGTSATTYYRMCLANAERHGSAGAELTCQYLADTLPG